MNELETIKYIRALEADRDAGWMRLAEVKELLQKGNAK